MLNLSAARRIAVSIHAKSAVVSVLIMELVWLWYHAHMGMGVMTAPRQLARRSQPASRALMVVGSLATTVRNTFSRVVRGQYSFRRYLADISH